MKKLTLILTVCFVLIGLCGFVSHASAQFSQPVIVLKGVIHTHDSTFVPAKLSVRSINDTAQEITSSTANTESGKYLVVLKPEKKYWIHIESDVIETQDLQYETPKVEHSVQVLQDFTVRRKGE